MNPPALIMTAALLAALAVLARSFAARTPTEIVCDHVEFSDGPEPYTTQGTCYDFATRQPVTVTFVD